MAEPLAASAIGLLFEYFNFIRLREVSLSEP